MYLHVPKESSHAVESWELILSPEHATLDHQLKPCICRALPQNPSGVPYFLWVNYGELRVFAIRSPPDLVLLCLSKVIFHFGHMGTQISGQNKFPTNLPGWPVCFDLLWPLWFYFSLEFSLSLLFAGLFSSKPIISHGKPYSQVSGFLSYSYLIDLLS